MNTDTKLRQAFDIATKELNRGELHKALQICERVLSKRTQNLEFRELRLQVLVELQHTKEALSDARQLTKLYPQRAVAWVILGRLLLHRDSSEAEYAFKNALSIENNAQTWCLLGQLLRKTKRRGNAISCLQKAYQMAPNNPEILTNLGLLQYDLGLFKSAVQTQRAALQVAPNQPTILTNLGNALRATGDLTEALEYYDRALELAPNAAGVEWNRAVVLLLSGNYKSGFSAMEGRFNQKGRIVPEWLEWSWDGRDLQGGILLIEAEQGFGDLIQFARFFLLASKKNAVIVLRCHPRMQKIMRSIPGITDVCSNQKPPPAYQARISLFSLPKVLGLSSPFIGEQSYLKANSLLQKKWKKKLNSTTITIGIAWQGNPGYEEDHHRSIPLQHYQPLFQNPNTTVYSLQKFHGAEQLLDIPEEIRPINLGKLLDTGEHAFEDTSAVLSQLDLVISSDTSIVHLAGALGVQTWVLLPYAPDWRWGLASQQTDWYTTMRLFRQQTPGDWEAVINEVNSALRSFISEKEQL